VGAVARRLRRPGPDPERLLLCWIGGANYLEICNTIAKRLNYVWPLTMHHDAQRLYRGMFIRFGGCAVAWFMKPPAQRRSFPVIENGIERRITPVVQSVIKGTQNKALHEWAQGDAAWQWIEPLTAPGQPYRPDGHRIRTRGQTTRSPP
jgi:hypothetical protein